MARKDQLAQGAPKASYGPLSGVSSAEWERIFGKPEVGMYKDSKPVKASKKL